MFNKSYKTLLATLVLATGLSVVPASTVQAEVVHITNAKDAEHPNTNDEIDWDSVDWENWLKDKDGNLIKGRNGVYYKRVKAFREFYTTENCNLVRKGKEPKGMYYIQTLAIDSDGCALYEVGINTPFEKPANGSFYAIKGTDDLFIFNHQSGGSVRDYAYDYIAFEEYEQLKWALDESKIPGYQRDDILPYLKVTCSKPDMLKISNREDGGKSFKWVKTGTCKITLELDSYKISYPVKVLSNTTKNNKLAIRHNVTKEGMSELQKAVNTWYYINDIVNKPKKEFIRYDSFKYRDWVKKNNAFVNRCYGYSYVDLNLYSYSSTNLELLTQLIPNWNKLA